MELPLGLSLTEILLHLLNFFLLLVGIRLLLWKPVKKFMEKRQAEYRSAQDSSDKIVKETESLKQNYNNMLKDFDEKKTGLIKKITEDAYGKAEVIISDAKIQAKEIIVNSKKTAEEEASKIKNEMEGEIIELSVNIAEKLLEKELLPKDNNKLIDECLEEWKKNEQSNS